MNILIVDDEASARRDLRQVLSHVMADAKITEAGNAASAMEICQKKETDVVFLDIRMPHTDGLELAKELAGICPSANIIMTTAYPEFALEAHRLYVSGYILKPVMEEDVREALQHLRRPVKKEASGLFVRCFGNFEVFYDGKPLKFGRSQAKELFAYLIDRRGAAVTNAECRAVLFGDLSDGSARERDYFHHIWVDLKETLNRIGCADVLFQGRNAYAVVPDRIHCDYYECMTSGNGTEGQEEYMNQYSWAEGRICYNLSDRFPRNSLV